MLIFPADICFEIFQYLDLVDILKLQLVSKRHLKLITQTKWRVQIHSKSINFSKIKNFHIFKMTLDAYHLKSIPSLTFHLEELTLLNCKVALDLNKLNKLRKLSLISCEKVIIDIPSLTYLNLAYSQAEIINCKNVVHLDLGCTKIKKLPFAPKVTHLSIDYTSITDIFHLNELTMLSIEGTNVEILPNPEQLRYLNISYTPITETQLLNYIPYCTALNTLEMEGLSITSLSIECLIKNNIPLLDLNLNDTNVYSHDVIPLAYHHTIKSLSIDQTRVDQVFINHMLEKETNLIYISALDILQFDFDQIKLLQHVYSHLTIHVSDAIQ